MLSKAALMLVIKLVKESSSMNRHCLPEWLLLGNVLAALGGLGAFHASHVSRMIQVNRTMRTAVLS
jgi:hypothetical protein